MPAPTNISFATATDLGTLPASVSQNVHDAGTTYTVYHKFTAPVGAKVVGVFGFGDLVTYKPTVSIHHGSLPTPGLLLGLSSQNAPVQFPVEPGEVYYIKSLKNGANPTPAVLLLEVEVAPDAALPIEDGEILVNDDTDGFPLARLSGDVDNTVLGYVKDIAPGEAGDMLPGGPILLGDRTDDLKLYDLNLTLLLAIPWAGYGQSNGIRAQNTLRRFYAGIDTNPPDVKVIDEDGNVLSTHTLTGMNALQGIAANNDGTILYVTSVGHNPINRWDLVNDVFLSDLVGDFDSVGSFSANTWAGFDILVLADDTVVFTVLDRNTGRLEVFRYSPAGVELNNYLITTDGGIGFPDSPARLAYAADDPDSFWVWWHVEDGVSRFENIRISDGAVLTSRTHTEYETGKYIGDPTATPTGRFGNSVSCPFIVARSVEAGESPAEEEAPAVIGPLVWWHFRRRVSETLEAESPLAPAIEGGEDPPADPDDGDGDVGTVSVGDATTVITTADDLQAEVAALVPGNVLMLRGGTYPHSLFNTIPAGVSWSELVRIVAYPGETVWLTPPAGSNRCLNFRGVQKYIELDGINLDARNCIYDAVKIEGITPDTDNAHHIRLRNLEIKNAPLTSHSMHVIMTALVPNIIGGNQFLNVKVHGGATSDFAHGFYIQSSNNRFEDCEGWDIAGAVYHVYNGYNQSPNDNLLIRCIARDGRASGGSQRGWGFIIAGGVGTRIDAPLVYNIQNAGGGSAGIYLFAGSGTEIYHPTVADCAAVGLRVEAGVTGTVIRNLIAYNNAGGNYQNAGSGTSISHSTYDGTNPVFVGGGDYHLQASSPVKANGLYVIAQDLDGVAFLNPPSRGCYQYL